MRKSISMVAILMALLFLAGCGSTATMTTTATINTMTTTATPTVTTTAAATTTTTAATTTQVTTTLVTTTQATTTAKSAITAQQVVQKLKAAGLPVSNIVVFNENNDPNKLLGRPNQYTSKANFSDPAHKDYDKKSPDNTVEVFTNVADAQKRADYVKTVSSSMSSLAQYIYLEGVYILRIHHDITPTNAKKYEAAFLAAVK